MKKLYFILITLFTLITFQINLSFGQCLNLSLGGDPVFNIGERVIFSVEISGGGPEQPFSIFVRQNIRNYGQKLAEFSYFYSPSQQLYQVELGTILSGNMGNSNLFSNDDIGSYSIWIEQEGCEIEIQNFYITNQGFGNCSEFVSTDTTLFKNIGDTVEINVQANENLSDVVNLSQRYYKIVDLSNNIETDSILWSGNGTVSITDLVLGGQPFSNDMAGTYIIVGTQAGCKTNTLIVNLSLPGDSIKQIPFYDSFEKMTYNSFYLNWKFRGVYRPNDSSALANKNIKSLWNSLRYSLDGSLPYNALYHGPDSSIYSYPDTIISSLFSIPDTSTNKKRLRLKFDYVHYLADSTQNQYDTLIVKAIIGNNQTPVQLFKKGGLELRTTELLDTTRGYIYPSSNQSYDWKKVKIDLSQYDTATKIKFMIILKPVSSLNYRESNTGLTIIDNFLLKYIYDTLNPETPPTLTVDTVYNYDRTHTLTAYIPNNHNSFGAILLSKRNGGYDEINFVRLDTNQTDTTYTYTVTNTLNGKYIYYIKLILNNGSVKEYSPVTVYTNFQYPPVGIPRLDVDSTRNKDRTYKLRVFLPPDHNSDIIKFYDGNELIKTNELIGVDNELTSTNIAGGFKLIEYTRTKVSNGLHKHTVSIGNTQDGYIEITDNNNLDLKVTDTVQVLVDTFTAPITDFNPVIDNPSPSTGTYTLKIPLTTRHNATQYEISENGRVISSGLLNPENRTSTILNFRRKNAGTYTYTVRVFNKTTQIVKSNINFTSTYVPPPVVDISACTTSTLTAPNRSRASFRYSFRLNDNCPTNSYRALLYSGQAVPGVSPTNANLTQTQINRLTWKPEGGSVRNSGFTNGNIKFTSAEISSKVFNRVMSPLPLLSNRWYKLEIVCTTCSQTNKKRVGYFYVTN